MADSNAVADLTGIPKFRFRHLAVTHIDRRILEPTKIAVAGIDRNPSLVQAGPDNIARWTRQKGGYAPRRHAGWKALIEEHRWSTPRTLLLADSGAGQRRRSSHPFIGPGFVTEAERAAIYAA